MDNSRGTTDMTKSKASRQGALRQSFDAIVGIRPNAINRVALRDAKFASQLAISLDAYRLDQLSASQWSELIISLSVPLLENLKALGADLQARQGYDKKSSGRLGRCCGSNAAARSASHCRPKRR
jgi:hypothetical protein